MKFTKDDKIKFGERIKQIRLEKGMTTKEFGSLLGATDSNITSWEKGRTSPNPERLKMISKIADISVEELLYGNYYRYFFNSYWKKWINTKRKKIDNFILSEERLKLLEKEKEKIFEDFYNKVVNLGFNDKSSLEKMGESIFLISVKGVLVLQKMSEAVLLENLISYIKDEKEKIDNTYFKIIDGEKHFKDDFSKVRYEKLTLATQKYIQMLEELLNNFSENYDYN